MPVWACTQRNTALTSLLSAPSQRHEWTVSFQVSPQKHRECLVKHSEAGTVVRHLGARFIWIFRALFVPWFISLRRIKMPQMLPSTSHEYHFKCSLFVGSRNFQNGISIFDWVKKMGSLSVNSSVLGVPSGLCGIIQNEGLLYSISPYYSRSPMLIEYANS